MNKRLLLFLTLSCGLLLVYAQIMQALYPPRKRPEPPKVAQEDPAPDEPRDAPAAKDQAAPPDDSAVPPPVDDPPPAVDGPPQDGDRPAAEPPDYPLRRVALGSLDPASPFRMLVTLTSRGAAIERLELNSPRYWDQADPSGYLGHLNPSDAAEGGCAVGVVGSGTPADLAGLQAGDAITGVNGTPILTAADLIRTLQATLPGQQIKIAVRRDGADVGPLTATLVRRPLELIRPEWRTQAVEVLKPGQYDQLSLLLTLDRVGDLELLPKQLELDGVALRDGSWNVTRQTSTLVEFTLPVPGHDLEVVKRYELAAVPKDKIDDPTFKAYHLLFDIEIRNTGTVPRQVAYRLDGPTGLPTEGWWYTSKIGRQWGGRRLRDVAFHEALRGPKLIDGSVIVEQHEEGGSPPIALKESGGQTNPLGYVGVDSVYFSAILVPSNRTKNEQRYRNIQPLVVGDIPEDSAKRILTDVTSRVTSEPQTLAAGAQLKHSFVFFAGPKQPDLLMQYGPQEYPTPVTLEELIYYGWPIWGFFAKRLSDVLHMLYAVVGNYAIAIVLLTVMVRLCMFPLSRKQALGAQKMQELQPEMKRISEKYKNDLEKRSKALQEMYKKHNYNPLAGCLPLFIQLPIFIGLYRALMIDIELRQAPLISQSFPWCRNLAAPDMLWRWEGLLPFLVTETGFLGPYLNVLPLITVVLFIWQQKMFMPPPADEQAALQQKIMQYMMIFFGVLFFKVPAGLCIYFITSSLWGLGERKFLPKKQQAPATSSTTTAGPPPAARPPSTNDSPGNGHKKAKQPAAAASGGGNRRRKGKKGRK